MKPNKGVMVGMVLDEKARFTDMWGLRWHRALIAASEKQLNKKAWENYRARIGRRDA